MVISDMIQFIAVLLMPSIYENSFEKALEELPLKDCNILPKERMLFINKNLLVFPAKRRGQQNDKWASQCDSTKCLDTYERTAYEMSRSVSLSSNHTIII